MTITEQALPGTEFLPPTPAGRAAAWYLGAAVPGGRLPEDAEAVSWVARVAAGDTPSAAWAGFFSLWQSSDWAVAEILDADPGEASVSVAVRAVDGRVWDITLAVDDAGRIIEDRQSRRRTDPLRPAHIACC